MAPENQPVLLYDGTCGFCQIWIEYGKVLTGEAITYTPSQDAGHAYPQILPAAFGQSVQLVLPSGTVLSGALAVFTVLAENPAYRWPVRLYDRLPGFAASTEAAYRWIVHHRNWAYQVTVWLFGHSVKPLRFEAVQWLFRMVLAALYLIAFLSFGRQAAALIGSHGVAPVALYFSHARQLLGHSGWQAAPSLLWLQTSDVLLQSIWMAGAVFAALAMAGVLWRSALLGAFVCYLSLLNASQEFLSYQWDILLLEAGFLSVFLGTSRLIVWLLRWLLFRLMMLSGAVKLLSGDPSWHNLTALTFHFQTQPLPTPLAWYAHQLPAGFLQGACFFALAVELLVPFLVLGPRRVRLLAAPWLIGLQILILLTGNYAFFNWLSLALCLWLFDDSHLARWLPRAWTQRSNTTDRRFVPVHLRRPVTVVLTLVVGLFSTLFAVQALWGQLPMAASTVLARVAPWGITSSYGLFATMTTTRPEIVIEGSHDGVTWLAYEFRYKPGRLDRQPPWVAPHQPRLDWQMWFAALGSYPDNVWFLNLLARLLQGHPTVLAQLDYNPFPGTPPQQVRARLYEYQFTDWRTRQQTGAWWTRTPLGWYVPPVSLRELASLPLLTAERQRDR